MEIITETPTKQATEFYTLDELRQLKATWLEGARADGTIQTCREVAQALGEPFTPKGRDT